MKVNFSGNFKEILRVLNTEAKSVEPARKPSSFEGLLKSISPERLKAGEIKGNFPNNLRGSSGSDDGPMASLKLDSARTLAPPLERLTSELDTTPAVTEPDSTVKTPTLLDARRIPKAKLTNVEREKLVSDVKLLVDGAGKKHGVDPALGMAVVAAESSFDPHAISSDGHASKGLFQLLDSTGHTMLKNLKIERHYNPYDPHLNVDLGVGYLRRLHDLFSRDSDLPNKSRTVAAANSASLEKLAVAAFNAGEGRVASAQGRAGQAGLNPAVYEQVRSYLPDSTQEYVEKVMRYKGDFESS